jgi:uncharacterized protein
MKRFLKENEWWFYFPLTFLLSWPVWIAGNLLLPKDMRMIILIVGGFGPLAAAIILIVLKEGKSGLKGWLRKTFNFRVKVIWYLLGGILLPFAIAAVHHLIYLAFGGRSGIDFSPQWLEYFAYLIPTTLLTGGNEEPGWRGYITPVLLNRFHPLFTFIIVGIGWAVWHSPLYLTGIWGSSDQPFIWLLIYAIPLSVLLTWLYYKSRESIIPVMLLHAGTNVVFRFFPMETKVFESFSDEFTVIKTVVYFFFAIMILFISKGKFQKVKEDFYVK